MNLNKLVIYCVDIGNINRNCLGWARRDRLEPAGIPSRSSNLPHLVEALVNDLNQRRCVALGFEAPLFIPLGTPDEWNQLHRMRRGERRVNQNYAWSAGAGREALFASLPVIPWLLDATRQQVARSVRGHVDWLSFVSARGDLVVWEAFVTGPAVMEREPSRPLDDMLDAAAGATALDHRLGQSENPVSDITEDRTYSLAAAALLRTGWTTDISVLFQQCLVVWTQKPPRRLNDLRP